MAANAGSSLDVIHVGSTKSFFNRQFSSVTQIINWNKSSFERNKVMWVLTSRAALCSLLSEIRGVPWKFRNQHHPEFGSLSFHLTWPIAINRWFDLSTLCIALLDNRREGQNMPLHNTSVKITRNYKRKIHSRCLLSTAIGLVEKSGSSRTVQYLWHSSASRGKYYPLQASNDSFTIAVIKPWIM